MNFKKDLNRLEVYNEIRKSKTLVGILTHDAQNNRFTFDYDRKYLRSKNAIAIGPELPLIKEHYVSKKNELFPSFVDRIPSKENPAYPEYCAHQGISPTEKNPITLLTTIGKRGPSTLIFEAIYITPNFAEELREFRKRVDVTLREVAAAFDIHLPTLSKIETGKSKDKNTLKLIGIYLNFPSVGLWQVQVNKSKLHKDSFKKLIHYFEEKMSHAPSSQ